MAAVPSGQRIPTAVLVLPRRVSVLYQVQPCFPQRLMLFPDPSVRRGRILGMGVGTGMLCSDGEPGSSQGRGLAEGLDGCALSQLGVGS